MFCYNFLQQICYEIYLFIIFFILQRVQVMNMFQADVKSPWTYDLVGRCLNIVISG